MDRAGRRAEGTVWAAGCLSLGCCQTGRADRGQWNTGLTANPFVESIEGVTRDEKTKS